MRPRPHASDPRMRPGKIRSLHVAIRCVHFTQTNAYTAYDQPQADLYTIAPNLSRLFFLSCTVPVYTWCQLKMPRKPGKVSPPVSDDSMERLIEMVRENPCLYDPCDKDHMDALMTANIWSSICKKLLPDNPQMNGW